MRTMTMDRIEHYRGKPVYSADGEKIGSVDHVYYNADTNEPEWLTVGAGILANRHSMVPLRGSRFEDESIVVPFTRNQVKESPDVAPDSISRHLEKELYAYYGRHDEGGQQFGKDDRESAEPVHGEARIRRWEWQSM